MIYTCFVIDDEPMAREILESFVLKVDFLQLKGSYTNPVEANRAYLQDPVDLFFLDISMPEISGLSFLKTLHHPPKVIFTTAYAEYAVESYEFNAVDYLLKPIAFERFLKAINKLATNRPFAIPQFKIDHVFLRVNGIDKRFLIQDILFVQSYGNYIKIFTEEKVWLSAITFKALEKKLPASNFIRIHRTTIVNIEKVNHFKQKTISINEHELTVGRSYLKWVKERLVR